MIDGLTMKALRKLGSEWEKGGKHRFYFNNLHGYYGLELDYYNTGNISGAWLDGDKISNSAGSQYDFMLRQAKVWFDVVDGKFYAQNLQSRDLNKIVSRIRAAIEGMAGDIDDMEMR